MTALVPVVVKPPQEMPVVQVKNPAAVTLNWLVPPTCKSTNSDVAADAVFVTFSLMPVNATAPAFQVCVMFSTG